jgi:hypothetical protein
MYLQEGKIHLQRRRVCPAFGKINHDAASHPKTNENLATKARRHKAFIYNKTFCVTSCLCVFVAIFKGGDEYERK